MVTILSRSYVCTEGDASAEAGNRDRLITWYEKQLGRPGAQGVEIKEQENREKNRGGYWNIIKHRWLLGKEVRCKPQTRGRRAPGSPRKEREVTNIYGNI